MASAISRSQATPAFLSVLFAAIARYGVPERLVSDGGSVFKATHVKAIYAALGIEHIRIDPGQRLLACPGQAGVGRDHRAHGHAELREPAEPGKPGQVRGVVVPGQVELAGPGHDPAAQSDPLHQRLGAQAGQPRGVVPPELRLAHTARRDDADACDNDTVHAFPPTASG